MSKFDYIVRDKLIEKVRTVVQEKTFSAACAAAAYASQMTYDVAMLSRTSGGFGFYNVTGNLLASMGFTVSRYDYGRGVNTRARSYAPISHHKRPLRASLRGGEKFGDVNTPYYSGTTARQLGHKPYKAPKSGFGSTYGVQERKDFINMIPTLSGSTRGAKNFTKGTRGNFWTIYAYVAMPYAGMVEGSIGHGGIVSLMSDFVAYGLRNKVSYKAIRSNPNAVKADDGHYYDINYGDRTSGKVTVELTTPGGNLGSF